MSLLSPFLSIKSLISICYLHEGHGCRSKLLCPDLADLDLWPTVGMAIAMVAMLDFMLMMGDVLVLLFRPYWYRRNITHTSYKMFGKHVTLLSIGFIFYQ